MTSKMKVRVRNKSSSTPVSKTISKEASPDSKCPICLDHFKNISYVDKCLHRFCFCCIQEWSKNKAQCPLCKQSFSSIYHSIKAEDDFKQFNLRPSDSGSFGSLSGQRFRYRTTLTNERRAFARRTSPPPDHGVMFEGLAGPTAHGNDRGFQRMLARLAAGQRAQAEGRTLRTPREQEMIRFRRTLYRRGLWVRGVRDSGRSREASAEFFRRNPACLHRLVPWLKRELTILYGTHGSLVNIVQHIVMSQITRYDMQDTAVLQELRPFLLSRTEHFLHEFLSFARSPFNMEAYDHHAVYDCPAPSVEESSDSDLSVVALSVDEGTAVSPSISSPAATVSHAAWDDETPGPSYSSEPPRVFTLPVSDSDTESSREEVGRFMAPPTQADAHLDVEDGESSGEEDCVIVGYVKPAAERTPELVQLSSDSEGSVLEERGEIRQQPQHIRFTSEPSSPASNRSEPRCPTPSFSAANEQPSHRHRRSPQQIPSKARTSCSEHHNTTSPIQKPSSKNPQREAEDDRRHHAKKTQKHRPKSGNQAHSYHRRRSRSQRRCSRDRVRAKEASDNSLSSRPPYTHHGYEGDRSSRSPPGHRPDKHTSRSFMSPERYSNPPSCSRGRSRSRSRARSRSRSRGRSRSRSRGRSRSRSRARSYRNLGHSESRCRNDSVSSHRTSRHKSSLKHKCKSLHLNQPSRGGTSTGYAQGRRRSREEHGKKKRYPSVEIVYEGGATEQHSRRHKKKKKKRKKSKKRRRRSKARSGSPSPTVITITSDSDGDGVTSDSAHIPAPSTADSQPLSTTPTTPADAKQLTSAINSTQSSQPLGGVLEPVEQKL